VISDISVSGCYVETITPEPAGTRLELRFQANGQPMRFPGLVRVVHPTMGMGIEFLNLTPENKARLQELVQAQSGNPL